MVDELTIVMPAFNEERRLPLALGRALAWCDSRAGEIRRLDVLVVDDGSSDATGELVRRDFAGRVRLVTRSARGGKGAAVRTGIEAVGTRWLCFTDADASIPFEELGSLIRYAESAPLVIGSKRAPGSDLRYPLSRRVLGAVGQRLISLCVVSGFYDTQCGIKLMRTDVARELARAGTIDGFGFDFELLYLAKRFGYPVVEVPIRCEHQLGGTIKASTYMAVLLQLARVCSNRARGVYPSRSTRAPAQGGTVAARSD
jgi:glycosyltransferase involved in cell wall biosynthesis